MFTKICKMSQNKLKGFVAKQLKETHNKIIEEDGFVYAQGTFPVLLVAHLDTVHKELPKSIIYNEKKDKLSSPQGIGGDDRCGVYMVLETIKDFNCSVLFCEDEEVGAIGADKFVKSKIAKNLTFNYIIEFDRKGKNDAVFYDCDNEDFEKFITKEFYKTSYGSFSDISIIAPFLGCAAVNISCGYYNAHTTNEYIIVGEMIENINQVCKILDRTTEKDKFEYIESPYKYNYSPYNWDSYGFAERYWLIEWYDAINKRQEWKEIIAESKVEAVGKFLMEHTTFTYNDIDVYDMGEVY